MLSVGVARISTGNNGFKYDRETFKNCVDELKNKKLINDELYDKTINFNLPVVGIKGSDGKMNDPYHSGKYLITAVRHKADQTGVFQTIIEICKESSPNAFENYKEWTQTALASLGI